MSVSKKIPNYVTLSEQNLNNKEYSDHAGHDFFKYVFESFPNKELEKFFMKSKNYTKAVELQRHILEASYTIKALKKKLSVKDFGNVDEYKFEYESSNNLLGMPVNMYGQTIRKSENDLIITDDLLYDIYVSSEIVSFYVKYFYPVVISKNLEQYYMYNDIIHILLSDWNTYIDIPLARLRKSLLSQKMFLSTLNFPI